MCWVDPVVGPHLAGLGGMCVGWVHYKTTAVFYLHSASQEELNQLRTELKTGLDTKQTVEQAKATGWSSVF